MVGICKYQLLFSSSLVVSVFELKFFVSFWFSKSFENWTFKFGISEKKSKCELNEFMIKNNRTEIKQLKMLI